MKMSLMILSFFAMSPIFAEYLSADESAFLYRSYLSAGNHQNTESQPVYLHNDTQEKGLNFDEMTILDLDIASTMQTEALAERILYGDADVVHLENTSAPTASHLYEILHRTYSHFIHVPNGDRGSFVASKYPLSHATVTVIEENETSELEFFIHGANTYNVRVRTNDLSMQVIDSDDKEDNITAPILLVDVPGTLTVMKQHFFPLRHAQKINRLSAAAFEILPVRKNGGEGYKAEVEVGRSWGGRDGGHWEASARVEAHDNHGNYVQGEARQNDRGEGSMNAKAGHEEK